MKMKKPIFISLFLIIMLSGQVFCQSLTVGVKGGPIVSGILPSKYSPPTDKRIGFVAGVGLLKSMSDNISLGAELNYEQKGYGDQYIYTDIEGNVLPRETLLFLFDYLTLPCYVRFHTLKSINWFLDIGMYPAYMISARVENPSMNSDGSLGPRKKYKMSPRSPYMRDFDIGALIGGGMEFKIRDNTTFNLNLRYNNGLISVFDKGLFGPMRIYSLSFSAGLMYQLR